MSLSAPFWRPTAIPPRRCMAAQAGPLRLWILRADDRDWHVCARQQEETASEPLREADPPDDAAWSRFAAPADAATVRLTPALPDQAVVIRPAIPIEVLPGGTAEIFVSIPCWVRVELAGDTPLTLCERPSQPLSKTWFGENTQTGEICFSIRTRARRTPEEITDTDGRIICPVTIRNASNEKLPFSRLCIRTPYMGVYGTPDGALWANQTTLVHRAARHENELNFSDSAPAQAARAELLCSPRASAPAHALRGLFSFV